MDDNETTCELVKGALRAEITNIILESDQGM